MPATWRQAAAAEKLKTMPMSKDKVTVEVVRSANGSRVWHVYAFDGPTHWAIFVAEDEAHAKRLERELRRCTGWTIE
jgi:hypothetical protein